MKFRVKMTLCMLGLLSLLFGLGGTLLITTSFANSVEQERDRAFDAYQTSLSLLQFAQQGSTDELPDLLGQMYGQNAMSGAGFRLFSSEKAEYTSGGGIAAAPQPETLPASGQCQAQFWQGTDRRYFLLLSGRVTDGDTPLFLQVAYDISGIYETRRFQLAVFVRVFAVAVLLCALLAYTLSRLLTAPVEGLSRASRAIASGQYASRVHVRSKDEVGQVAADFNRMAAALEHNIEELQQSVERQERFLGSFAHELKTPMTSLVGYAEMLCNEDMDKTERTEAARYIFSASKRLETLSRKLLQLLVVQNDPLPLVPAEPRALLTDMVSELRPIYAPVRLAVRGEAGVCLLEPDLFRSLMLNLLDNARKAVDADGIIGISQTMLPDGCRIEVRDNGRGIPPAALDQLTQPFFRVDKARSRKAGGAGLGLALCREIVQLHNGTLHFSSAEGRGTCVTIELKGGRPCETD